MKNIIRVFRADNRRLSKNVVAIVMIIGLIVIPSLYAWFNILSNWDPYGSSATSNMSIAVCSTDKGDDIAGININVGDKVISALEANKVINWIFLDGDDQALEGVKSGDYYAAILIPEDFTEDLLSFLTGSTKDPSIIYVENSKKNAIATKITSKVKKTVAQEINSSFVETLTEALTASGDALFKDGGIGSSLVSNLTDKLNELDQNLALYVSVLDAFSSLTDSASGLTEAADALIPGLSGTLESGRDTIDIMSGSLSSASSTTSAISGMVGSSIDAVSADLDLIISQISSMSLVVDMSGFEENYKTVEKKVDKVLELAGDFVDEDNEIYQNALAAQQTLKDAAAALKSDKDATTTELEALKSDLSAKVEACKSALAEVKNTFVNDVASTTSNAVNQMASSLSQVQSLLSSVDASFGDVSSALSSYRETLNTGTASLSDTRDYVSALRTELKKITDGLTDLTQNETLQKLLTIWSADPETLAAFVASPVSLEEEKLFEIENYGSAMAPFYTVLALWVGALILSAIFRVKVKKEASLDGVRTWEKFFGRYLTFFLVGQLQSLLVITGDLFFAQIQCLHPGLLYLAGSVISFSFTILIYALTVAFGNIGQAAAVIIMVIQVAGAGGTFPIEVLPTAYQAVYKFLPFVYSMDAMRGCIGGLYGNDYLRDMGILLLYALASIIIVVIFGRPFKKIQGAIEKSKEATGFMV